MLRRYIFGFSLALFYLVACKSSGPVTQEKPEVIEEEEEVIFQIGEVTIQQEENDGESGITETYDFAIAPEYKGSATRIMDLEHSTLKIRFDWEKQLAHGNAILNLKAYSRPVDSFYIDALAMIIHSVTIRENGTPKPCYYSYDGEKILVRLNETHTKEQHFQLIIDYTAQPEKVEDEGGSAITDSKGLYFINPLNEEKGKARQIWTQGETQSTSAWFPTIDAPNEKLTHDIFVTVADSLQTISNGEFMSSTQEGNGLRTDHWRMDMPHAPYLVALVVGQFYSEKAEWNDIPLGYHVDPRYTNSAKTIFQNTPEMLSFFSKRLNYPYPWPKYDQVVVDDFVSGAMENTTLTIFGRMLQLGTRELLDEDYEDVISHELFHHWFGDLVTCESWGQLPLNESFATYGEYLWREHKYGRDNADEHLYDMLQQYFVEAYGKQVKLIREDYFHPDEMFDAHSYQKGGLILHMLRNYLGDQVFFDGLNLYLKKFQYGTAEIHNLRQCFEESSGEDLTWFFEQWFFKAGHPLLEVIHNYDEEINFYTLQVNQTHDLQGLGAYRLPVKIDFHFGDSVYSEVLDIRNSGEFYNWEMPVKPDWVGFDASNQLLAKVREIKSQEEWLAQLKYSKLFNDRQNALLYLNEEADNMELLYEACAISLTDPYYRIRIKGMDLMKRLEPDRIASFSMLIIDQAENHPKSATRAAALSLLAYNPISELDKTIQKGLNDSSFKVNGAALNLLEKTDPEAALKQAEKWAESPEDALKYTALGVLAKSTNDYSATFVKAWQEEEGNKFYLVAMISQYLKKSNDAGITITLLNLINDFEPEEDDDFFVVLFIAQCNQQTEAKWQDIKEASIDNPIRQAEAERVLQRIIHIY
ncbi:MAG TPA: hypothetical protein DIW47_10785 [Bacteroidetes bacterium]|nr:hypothetical protein [Bacteroidota bacterium]